jgi:hypothetical protein
MKIPEDVRSILDMDPALTMRIYSMFEGENTQYFVNTSAILVHSWSSGMYAKNIDDLLPLLKHIPKANNNFLNGISNEILPLLEKSFPKIIVSDPCHIWTLQDPPSHQSPLESLSNIDSPFIDKNWSYHSDDSLWHVNNCIENNPSSVIRDDEGKLAGWAFSY